MTSKKLWHYTLQPEDEGLKYYKILNNKFHFSRRLLQKLKLGEKVWVNGKFTYLTARGHAGEVLSLELSPPEESTIPGTPLTETQLSDESDKDSLLKIIYEDQYLLAINKPAGLVIHPNPRYPTNTLANYVIGYWENKGEPRPFRPVYRIDRNTSGVIIVAKNHFAHQQLAWQSEQGKIHKRYLGIVEGIVKDNSGKIDFPIGLAPGSFIQRQIQKEGLPAKTRFRVLKRYSRATLLEFVLDTGRTHQIRAHSQAIGHPLLGDDLYSGDTSLISRQALHSFVYSFLHPATGKQISFRAPLPQDLIDLIKKLK